MDAIVLSPSAVHAAIGIAAQLVFPCLALGLACYLAVLEGLWVTTRNEVFRTLYGFWANIFGVCFGLGLVAVLTLGRTLGWNWSGLELSVAITALAALLAAMLFGRDRVGAAPHVLASVLMAAGLVAVLVWTTSLSAPAPARALYESVARFALSAFIVTALAVGTVAAWRLLRQPEETASATALRMSVGMLAISAILRLLIGDLAWRTPLGVEAGPEGWTLQIEAGLGAAVVWLALWAGWLVRRRGGPERSRSFLRSCLAMGAVGSAALFAGWTLGRMEHMNGMHEHALAATPAATLALWAGYAVLFGAGGFLILRLAARPGPDPADGPEPR